MKRTVKSDVCNLKTTCTFCPQLLSMFLTKDPRQSRLSDSNKGDEMIPGAVHRSPGVYLTTEENSGKPQLGLSR